MPQELVMIRAPPSYATWNASSVIKFPPKRVPLPSPARRRNERHAQGRLHHHTATGEEVRVTRLFKGRTHQSRTPSPTRHVVRDSDTVIVSPPRVAAVLSRGVTTPKRHQSSGETKTKVVGSPYTADAEARLAKLKALLSSH
mgnify:CR=1 FL=1